MEQYDETIFEAVTKIVASTTEENEEIVSADGGKQVAAYFPRGLRRPHGKRCEAGPGLRRI